VTPPSNTRSTTLSSLLFPKMTNSLLTPSPNQRKETSTQCITPHLSSSLPPVLTISLYLTHYITHLVCLAHERVQAAQWGRSAVLEALQQPLLHHAVLVRAVVELRQRLLDLLPTPEVLRDDRVVRVGGQLVCRVVSCRVIDDGSSDDDIIHT
jgi:hypothetical protein